MITVGRIIQLKAYIVSGINLPQAELEDVSIVSHSRVYPVFYTIHSLFSRLVGRMEKRVTYQKISTLYVILYVWYLFVSD